MKLVEPLNFPAAAAEHENFCKKRGGITSALSTYFTRLGASLRLNEAWQQVALPFCIAFLLCTRTGLMMRNLIVVIGIAAALTACQPDAQTNNPAIATDEAVAERESSAPAAGASSFTEAQAQDLLISKGYTNPTALTKSGSGEWVGQASMNGQTVNVSVDYQGNVVAS